VSQDFTRRRRIPVRALRGRADKTSESVEEVVEEIVEEEPVEEETDGLRLRPRKRQRALLAGGRPGNRALPSGGRERVNESGGRGRIAAANGRGRLTGTRGQGRQRGGAGGSRRFVGRRRPNPPAYYYYDDYYYDPQYEEYYQDYEYEESVESKPERAKSAKISESAASRRKPFAGRKPAVSSISAPEISIPDIGDQDYGGLIKTLWEQFLREKEAGGGEAVSREPEVEYECPPQSDVSYYEPDEEQCDKYLECNIKGEIREHFCPDGFAFEPANSKCDYPVKVNCTTRPKLQEPQPSVNCSRANGFFAWPANISCQSFWDCRGGTAYLQTCPTGVIFDPQLATCATPDQSSRVECTTGEDSFLGFKCPSYTPDSKLRFGNHDRLPHPDNCQEYFTCLRTGGPRLATCGRKMVFNPESAQCGDPKGVPGCEDYWVKRLAEDEDEDYYDY